MTLLKYFSLSHVPKRLVPLVFSVLMASCGGGGGGGGTPGTSSTNAGSAAGPLTIPPALTGTNTIPITVDAGPLPTTNPTINVAYVSVTVCAPGAAPTSVACQTLDHVMVDTGSSGLRLLKSALNSGLKLPQVLNSAGSAIGECTPFGSGTTWGSVRFADVYLGGELVSNETFQDIGDTPGGATGVPQDCSATGVIQGNSGNLQTDEAALGANGILGVGPFANDCAPCLILSPGYYVPAAYYNCNNGGCSNAQSVTSGQIVQNPVVLLPQDNNGVEITLPAVSSAGANSLSGSLNLGVGTQSNNQLGSATVYAIDQYGNFTTTYNGVLMTASFIDSGSNGFFFDDTYIPICTINTWAYCPSPSPKTLNATNTAYGSNSGVPVTASLVGLDPLSPNVVAANIGGLGTAGSFDWGLPFFFGRPVFTVISGASAPVAAGPYFAY